MSISIGVVGCAGRMGLSIIKEINLNKNIVLSGGIEISDNFVGKDLGSLIGTKVLGAKVLSSPKELFEISDVIIDFTLPAATLTHSGFAAETQTAYVVGTTGLSEEEQAGVMEAATQAPILQSSNFSLGVNLLLGLTRKVASVLDTNYDVEVLEMHHRDKIDSPSGTALSLGKAAAEGRNDTLENTAKYVRNGLVGARQAGEIGFATLRGGSVVGDHSVVFAGDHERLELHHKASSRDAFSEGAVKAAVWLSQVKTPGMYGMSDVLGLN
jgi:4-hydroxy-tetrahydrodipicolinate reductase